MPLFMVRRNVPGISQEDMDAAAFRAITCAFYYSGLKWHRSFWDHDAGVLDCIYEAESAEELLAHAQRARIPCDEVREVDAFGPENYIGEAAAQQASA